MRLLPLFLAAATACAALTTPSTAGAQSQPDIDESIAQLGMGKHTLTGRPGSTRNVIAEAGKRRGLFSRGPKTERVYTRNQPVMLIPYTRLVEAITLKHKGDPYLISISLGKLENYTGRALTDANGVFHFRGLKPGRYLVSTTVRYEAAVTVREDTGRTRTDTTIQTDGYNVTGASSVTSQIYDYHDTTTELEHRMLKLVEVKADSPITDLGEMQ